MLGVKKKLDYFEKHEEHQPWLNDNKMMMNAVISERAPPPPPQSAVALNITELGKNRTQDESSQHIQQQPQQQEQHKKKSSLLRLRSRLRCNTLLDVIIFIIFCAIMVLTELGLIPHKKLGFMCKDPKYSYPYYGETISSITLFVVSIFGSLFLIIFIELLREKSYKRICPGIVWYYFKEGFIGFVLMILLTQIIKVFVGEPRPHFFNTCQPDANQYCQPGTFIIDYNCTNNAVSRFLLEDAERSFPSGHTAGSMFIALYCAYLVLLRLRDSTITQMTKHALITVCLLWTCICSSTRITDHRHHWWDVLAGAVLGVCGAFYAIHLMRNKSENNHNNNLMRSNTSTTLLDVKNKDATSVMI